MKPPTWLFLFLTAAVPALCGQDIDVRVGAAGGEGGRVLSIWAPAVALQYRGAFPLPKSLAVLVNEEFTGLFKTAAALPRPEINYPVVSVTTAGIAYGGYGTVQVRGFSQYLSRAEAIKFPISAAQNSPYHDAVMTQRFKNGADCFLDIPFWRFKLSANGLFNDLIFDCDTVFSKTDSALVRRLKTGCHDADAWGKAALAFDVFEKKLWLKGAACIKNDLNQYTGYNIEEYFAGLEGNTTVFSNLLDVNGDAFARYYQSDIMALNGFNTSFGTIGHLRLAARIPSNFFIKGDCAFETGTTMRKFRGQLCVRKAWLNRSSLEAGFW